MFNDSNSNGSPDLRNHSGFARLFVPGKLTIGFILPLETHPRSPAPSMQQHVEMAQKAEAMGFGCLWLRDIPFYDPEYGDVGQIFEPLAYIAHLAAMTRSIALGTAAVVLPIREPLLLAKQAATVDQLSGGRLVMGMSSGDRPSDYPLFGVDAQTRGERFREVFDIYRAVSEQTFPRFASQHFGRSEGELDLVPKPPQGRTPALAVGHAQQTLPWIASHMDGLISAVPPPAGLVRVAEEWTALVEQTHSSVFRPMSIGGFLDLLADPHHPVVQIRGGIRAGFKALAEYLEAAEQLGIAHLAMNLRVSDRPYADMMEELAVNLLPHFPSHADNDSQMDIVEGSATVTE